MNHRGISIGWLGAFAASWVWLATGCRTANVNPPSARPNTGYVDFYTDPAEHAYWYVARKDERSGMFKELYSEFRTPEGGIVRLALRPGRHVLRVAFLNKVFEDFWDCEVEVRDGMITPVRVQLVPARQAVVNTYKPMTRSRFPKIQEQVHPTFRIAGSVEKPVPYRPKPAINYPLETN